ncbi:hypothetical protein PAHAL_3G340200 [Panicum hallii]|uniref:Uncharacterized protein n=1 Tax=Panicum hallii TaxID=206008 RepID=A0A2T8KKG1_9POAL|nr:hypothetical protein PAHAL_3G340200 [Panicum hallii]
MPKLQFSPSSPANYAPLPFFPATVQRARRAKISPRPPRRPSTLAPSPAPTPGGRHPSSPARIPAGRCSLAYPPAKFYEVTAASFPSRP